MERTAEEALRIRGAYNSFGVIFATHSTESDIILMLFIDVFYTEFMHSHVHVALLG